MARDNKIAPEVIEWMKHLKSGAEIALAEVIEQLKLHHGDQKTKRILLAHAGRIPQRRKGVLDPARDAELFKLWDGKEPVQRLARRLHETKPGQYGSSDIAVDRRLRRLIAEDELRAALIAELDAALGLPK
jgi:hypothetical protein